MDWPFGDLPLFGFDVILCDPPWLYEVWGENSLRGTWPLLPQVLEVIDAWGFRYATCGFDWAKRTRRGDRWHMGLGYYTRANTEFCLFATNGQPGRPAAMDVRQLIVEPVREHSRKPDRIHGDLERLYPGARYLELFARQSERPGWTYWGDQASKFNTNEENDHATEITGPDASGHRAAPRGRAAGGGRRLVVAGRGPGADEGEGPQGAGLELESGGAGRPCRDEGDGGPEIPAAGS